MKNRTYLIISVLLLSIIGVIMIYSSSYIWAEYKYNDSLKYFKNQLLFLIIGLIFLYIISKIDYHLYYKKSKLIIFICIISLLLVLIPGLGTIRNGSRSWFKLGPFSIQPSEFTKLGLIIFTSKYLCNHDMKSFKKGVLPIFSGIISVVTTAIINILYYIFGELRCMKIYQPATDDEKDSADNKFVDIWNTFVVTVVTTFAMALANTAFPEYINTTVIMIAMFISSFALTSLVYLKDKKHNKAKNLIRNIAVPVLCYAFFAILQLPEAGTNV